MTTAMGGAPTGQTNMLGQPTGQPAAQAQTPATLDAILQANPHLADEVNAYRQWAAWAQQQYVAQQHQARQPQQQPGQPAQPASNLNEFGVPKWNRALEKFLTQDPQTGEVRAAWGAPPGILAEYDAYMTARKEAINTLLDEPMKLLGPLIEKALSTQGPQIADSRIQSVQERAFANNYVEANANWIFEQANGQVKKDFMGRPVLSQLGQMFQQKVQQLHGLGVRDQQAIQQAAEEYVLGRVAMARITQSQQQQQAADQGKQNLLNSAQTFQAPAPAGQGQAAVPQSVNAPTAPHNTVSVLSQAMRQAFAANGVSESAFA